MSSFTPAQRAAIRQYLGWSELFHDVDPRLEGMMSMLDQRAPDAVVRVKNNLVRLADIDDRITSALDNLDLTRAEDINFLGPDQLDALRNQGRMLVNQIAITFELRPPRDYFAMGDDGGGIVPLG